MKILALIPARMGSSRFPGKPMAPILGKPMIGHVYERVAQSALLTTTAVATCDKEIFEYIKSIGGTAVMTSKTHERASDRCAEALLELEYSHKTCYDIVVMVQGDEPMTHPDMIAEAIRPMLDDSSIQVVNLMGRINDVAEFEDRNCIKVACDLKSDAMYFLVNRYRVGTQVRLYPWENKYVSFLSNVISYWHILVFLPHRLKLLNQ